MKLKKFNNKGVTLVELIVSFALVSVAIIYFYQTLYTVNKLYNKSRNETNDFVQRTYALKLLDAYLNEDNASIENNDNNRSSYCNIILPTDDSNNKPLCEVSVDDKGNFKKYTIKYKIDKEKKSTYLYKYISTQSK